MDSPCTERDTPGTETPWYRHLVAATEVSDTHPTGMHTCYLSFCEDFSQQIKLVCVLFCFDNSKTVLFLLNRKVQRSRASTAGGRRHGATERCRTRKSVQHVSAGGLRSHSGCSTFRGGFLTSPATPPGEDTAKSGE